MEVSLISTSYPAVSSQFTFRSLLPRTEYSPPFEQEAECTRSVLGDASIDQWQRPDKRLTHIVEQVIVMRLRKFFFVSSAFRNGIYDLLQHWTLSN